MEPLFIEETKTTPRVDFQPVENRFIISGYSRPENVRDFYLPLLDWLDSFAEFIEKKMAATSPPLPPIEFQFRLIYFNSSSAKFLYDIISTLNGMKRKNIPLKISWYYDKEDVELLEAGQDLSELADVQFDFIAI